MNGADDEDDDDIAYCDIDSDFPTVAINAFANVEYQVLVKKKNCFFEFLFLKK